MPIALRLFLVVASTGTALAGPPAPRLLHHTRDLVLCQEAAPQPEPSDILDEARGRVGEGNYEAAVKLFQQYLVLVPKDRQARIELARVLSWDARYNEALAVYDELLQGTAYDGDIGVERAQVIGWTGDYKLAETAVREILALEPEHIEANLLLASLLEWQGREEESQEVYKWVLTLAPENRQAEGESEPEAPQSDRKYTLRFANHYSGDINGFNRFGSKLGLRVPVLPVFSLTPFAMASMMDDEETAAQWGIGGGLAIDWRLVKELDMGIEGGALYYVDLPDQVDWQGAFKVSTTPAEWLYLSLRLHTELYGEAGQSVAALVNGVRSWGGDLSAYAASGRFEMFALLTLLSLQRPNIDSSLVTTGMATPMFRLAGEKHKFYLGYKLWATGHSEASPVNLNYWSPARYFTHHLMVRLKGPAGKGNYFVEAGGGVGHEFEPATGVGTVTEESARWSFFPVAVAGAGLYLPLAENVDLETGGWTTFSRRLEDGLASQYILWFVEANLNIRW